MTKNRIKKQNNIINAILNGTKVGKMQKKINTLENENETLKKMLKDELYKDFINILNNPKKEKIISENKHLREKSKILSDENKMLIKKIERMSNNIEILERKLKKSAGVNA